MKLVNKCFPKGSPLSKIFNKNTVKISYSSMNNVKQIINANNKKLLRELNDNIETQPSQPAERKCNCRKKRECPLNGNCLQKLIIYQATVIRKDSNTQEAYVGLTDGEFKTRFRNHTASFRNQNLNNSTELSKFIWTLKANNIL